MKPVYVLLSFLGPGSFGYSLGRLTGTLNPQEGLMLMLVIPGLTWLLFGALCAPTLNWSLQTTATVCLRSMAAGSVLLGLASLGFVFGLGIAWGIFSILATHFLMLAVFLRDGRRLKVSSGRLAAAWFIGLNGAAILLVGVVACL
jgi:hypothetical protein